MAKYHNFIKNNALEVCLLNTFYYFCSSFLNSIKLYERNVQPEDPIQRTNNRPHKWFQTERRSSFLCFREA